MKRLGLGLGLGLFFVATMVSAMENEELKQKSPRVVFDSPLGIDGALKCIDEASEVWRRYFNTRDHRLYRKRDSVDIEYLTAPATIFAIQNRVVLISVSRRPEGGSHLQFWGVPGVDVLDPADAASRGHAAVHANTKSRLQQSIDSFRLCLAEPEPVVASAGTSAPMVSTADELIKLNDLKNKGIITQAEFDVQKARLLAPR